MLPSKGKHSKEYGKPPEEKEHLTLDFNVEGQIRNAAEGHVATQELTSAVGSVDPNGKKNPPVPLFGDLGDKVDNMLERLGANINKALHIKQQTLETNSESLKGSDKKIKQIWEAEQSQIEKINEEFSGKFAVLFQQWEFLMQDFDGKQEKLRREVQLQENTFEQSRIVQKKRVQTIRRAHEKFLKNLSAMEKNNDNLLRGAQNELKEDMNKLKRKLITETQRQELETVRQALQNMFS